MPKKSVAKKTPSKSAPEQEASKVVEVAEAQRPKGITFFFPKGNNSIFVWGRAGKDGAKLRSAVARVESNVIRVRPEDIDAGYIIEKLRNHKDNTANGGVVFVEVKTGKLKASDMAERIDMLNSMEKPALVAMLGGDIGLHRLTTGGLIAKALELD